MAVHTLWNIPTVKLDTTVILNANYGRSRLVQYNTFNSASTQFNSTKICPVGFKWLNFWDFAFETVFYFDADRLVARYQISQSDQWKDKPEIGWYMYFVSTLCMLATDAMDNTMTEWDVFYEYVMPSVQGCPVAMVKQALVSSAVEFCEKSLIWIQDSIQNDVVAGRAFYTYAPPVFAKVVMPYKVTLNGKELEPWDIEKLEDFDKNWKMKEDALPTRYVQVMDDTIRLVGIPTEDIFVADAPSSDEQGRPVEAPTGLMADVVLKPSRNALRCPSFLFFDWVEVIAAGALSRLHAQVGKVWAKPELVGRYDKVFKEGISRAKSKHDKSYQRESNQMRPVKFYGGRRYYN